MTSRTAVIGYYTNFTNPYIFVRLLVEQGDLQGIQNWQTDIVCSES